MRFSDKSLSRLATYMKLSEPVDPSWVEEYGDVETYDEPYEEESYGDFTEEEFIRGEMNLAFMGYDVEGLGKQGILDLIGRNPDVLKLTPRFSVQGRWAHFLRDARDIENVVESITRSNKEICATDANEKDFYQFGSKRVYGLVFEGVCKVLWNADMYSTEFGGKWQTTKLNLQNIEYINEMTEGYIVPSECKFVELRLNPGEISPQDLVFVQKIVSKYGVEFNEYGEYQKDLIDIEFSDLQDNAEYPECSLDVESPEHLYESPENKGFDNFYNYLEKYKEDFEVAVLDGNLPEMERLLQLGAEPDSDFLTWFVKDKNLEAINLLLRYGAEVQNMAVKIAAQGKDASILELLYNWGGDIYQYASESWTPMREAVAYDNLPAVKFLLSKGVDPSKIPDNRPILLYLQKNGLV